MTSGPNPPRPHSWEPTEIGADEAPSGHPFAHPSTYAVDIALLNYLLQDLRVVTRQIVTGEAALADYDTIDWSVHGLQRRTVICDAAALVAAETRQIVGFFGDRRSDLGDLDVDEAELDVIGQFRDFPGIISYSSIELVNDQWANLVVHATPTDRDDWRHSHVHIAAAESVAPRLYHNVRIHNGCIDGGPIGSETITLETTKYWNYDTDPVWHGFRRLPAGLVETTAPPAESANR